MSKIVKKSEVKRREEKALSLESPGRVIPYEGENKQPFWARKDFNSILPRRMKSNRKPQ